MYALLFIIFYTYNNHNQVLQPILPPDCRRCTEVLLRIGHVTICLDPRASVCTI